MCALKRDVGNKDKKYAIFTNFCAFNHLTKASFLLLKK